MGNDSEKGADILILKNIVKYSHDPQKLASNLLGLRVDYTELEKPIDEIIWWLNKTMAYLKLYRGVCRRFINIKEKSNPDVMKYYSKGKVFRWSNYSSALRVDEDDEE